jgi:hypothetical protein
MNAPAQEQIEALDEKVFEFIQTLNPILATDPPAVKGDKISTQAIAYSSMILLHDPVVGTDVAAYDQCLYAARLISTLMGHLQQGDTAFLSPFVTVSAAWTRPSITDTDHTSRPAAPWQARSLLASWFDQRGNRKPRAAPTLGQ